MIVALAVDGARVLLRGRALPLLAAAGVLLGLFVRATRATGSAHLETEDLAGAALDTYVGGVFLAVLLHGMVAALLLAAEDRESGLVQQVALRPVPRLWYTAGRLLGLVLAAALGMIVVVATSAPLSGLSVQDVPELRHRVLPERVVVEGRELTGDALAQLRAGEAARFEFGADAAPDASLRLHPKVLPGAAWSGLLRATVAYEPEHGARQEEAVEMRPLHALPLRFVPAGPGPFVLEVRLANPELVLEIGAESMVGIGPRAGAFGQLLLAAAILLLAGVAAAACGFVFSAGLSLGPAALAASFVLLIGLSRDVVFDLVAGIGRSPGDPPDAAGDLPARLLRALFSGLLRMVPDMQRFNPAGALGGGSALGLADLGWACLVALAAAAGAALLAAACLPLRERT